MATDGFQTEKMLFTEQDFDTMGWHDNPIHAFAFGPADREVSFDIDYIFKWEQPLPGEKYFRFWISPATLVFENLFDLKIKHDAYAGLTILGIEREESKKEGVFLPMKSWKWKIDCVEASWEFYATGYRQLIRKPPVLFGQQRLSLEQRQGYSFECTKRV
jgi:hypothetical protein